MNTAVGAPTLAVTIVSSQTELLIPCLDSLLKERPVGFAMSVYVAWNAPGRGGPTLPPDLIRRYPEVQMIESQVSGFPPNQNMLLSNVRADYYLVANDDLVFLPGSVGKPLEYLERLENCAVGMLTVKLLNRDGILQPCTYSVAGFLRSVLSVSGLRTLIPTTPRLHRLARLLGLGGGRSQFWTHDRTIEVESFRGAYMLTRGRALREVGLLDVRGGEETEWHIRFRRKGWKTVFFHEAEVIHLKSMTVSRDPNKDLINLRSFLNIHYKHESRWRYNLLRICYWLVYAAKYCAATLRGAPAARQVAGRGLSIIARWPNDTVGVNTSVKW